MAGARPRGGTLRRWLIRLVQLALTVVVTVFIAQRVGIGLDDFTDLGSEWWTPRWGLLALSCVALLVGNLYSGLIWGRMVVDLGGPRLPPGSAIRIFLVANLGRYVPGKLWQVAGLAVLARRRGVAPPVATGAAVFGHLLSLGAATLVGGLGLSSVTLGESGVPGWSIPAGVAVLLALGLTPPVFRPVARGWARLTRWQGNVESLSPLDAAVWVSMLLAAWVLYGAAFYLLALAFGASAPLITVAPAFVAAYVLGYVALFAPAGIGVREAALAGLLAPSVGTPMATGLAVVARLWATVIEVVPGALLAGREWALSPVESEGSS